MMPVAEDTGVPMDPRLLVTNANGPLISIILPAHNAGPYLRECVDSVLAQSWHHWELLLVDNGSTDGTAAIAASFTDPRIKVLSEPLQGVSLARNKGLAAMRGEFFCFLDADDRLPKDALRLRHDLFLRYPDARFADGAMRAFDNRTGKTVWVRSPWYDGMPFDALMALDGSCFARTAVPSSSRSMASDGEKSPRTALVRTPAATPGVKTTSRPDWLENWRRDFSA